MANKKTVNVILLQISHDNEPEEDLTKWKGEIQVVSKFRIYYVRDWYACKFAAYELQYNNQMTLKFAYNLKWLNYYSKVCEKYYLYIFFLLLPSELVYNL